MSVSGLRAAALQCIPQLVAVRFGRLAGRWLVRLGVVVGVARGLVAGHLVVLFGLEFGHGFSFRFHALTRNNRVATGMVPVGPQRPSLRYVGDMSARPIRILGIDPGLRRTGWGVIESSGNRLSYIACGSVEPDAKA